ncbi:MAG: nodulation protein NfeD [Deltaproteobacteria bacterium]|nr:nodulation protein NfeD [Deltaproteobacteria bacterium]MBW2332380.1 nodulation protein NfeD [Deltaproteobacteria bacterium]MCD6264803.1 nodulation protein NfeD [Deltaproteobacteria bacterium]
MKKSFFIIILTVFTMALFIHNVPAEKNSAMVIELDGTINPGTAQFVIKGLKRAEVSKHMLVIIRLDTPGGLDSSMRSIVKSILNSSVPVVVYVAPRGARAASAGVMITVAAHIAAMAPQTNIGAAHPVSADGKEINKTMSKKVVNDMVAYVRSIAKDRGRNQDWVEKAIRESVSITADVAVKKKVVDLVARDMDDLLALLDGREIALNKGKVTLETKGLKLIYVAPGWRDRVLNTISNPNIAYILMMIGMAGLYFELSHPGAIFPGVIGAISLILAFFAFQTLPVNYAGLLLIALAIVFFIAEIKVSSYGLLSVAGLISLTLGSIMLFENIRVSLNLMMPTIVMIGGFFVIIAFLAFRAYKGKPTSGMEGLIGQTGVVEEKIDPVGLIFAHGEYWKATSTEVAEQGEKVRIIGSKGLELIVEKVSIED